MTGDLEQALHQLRREYLAEAGARLAELRKDLAAYRAGEPDAADSLRSRFHRLAGSGGSYGFPDISAVARELEREVAGMPSPERLEAGLERLAGAFDRAAESAGVPGPLVRAAFGWRALVIGPPAELRREVVEVLEGVGLATRTAEEVADVDRIPLTERPDFVVVLAAGEDPDPYGAAGAWSAPHASRAVVIVDPEERADRVRAAAAGAAAVIQGALWSSELSRYARALSRVGAPPPVVLLVEDDAAVAGLLTAALEQAEIGVRHAPDATSAYDRLGREQPDLLLLDVRLPDMDGFALARLVRSDPRHSLLPIVFLTGRPSTEAQIEALRAGGDDFLTKPVDLQLLVHTVAARVERGRRIRELVHRDGLTGVLNHATLMAELEHGLAYARRHGESVSLLMIDLDHFKRINDRHGHLVGDQVLRHVARVFQHQVRSSDLIGRYGGEEFAVVLRRCGTAGAAATATKVRESLESQPAVLADGTVIPVRASIGVAGFPEDADDASGLAAAADGALYRAKHLGRNRVELAGGAPLPDR